MKRVRYAFGRKKAADKRRVNSKEELRRLFQISNQFHADELPTKAGIDKLDKLRFRDFLETFHKREYPDGALTHRGCRKFP